MQKAQIERKAFITMAVIAIVLIIAAGIIFSALNKAKGDAQIINALGRQRMLTQAMAKSALGYGMAKSEKENTRQQVLRLDSYITSMRAVFTDKIVKSAVASAIELSMSPEPGSLPFPATFTRFVNERFDKKSDAHADIVAQSPINPDKAFQYSSDSAAFSYLQAQPEGVYMSTFARDGRLYQRFYTADRATVDACVSCHSKYQGTGIRKGDILGIRRFDIPFANDVALGREILNTNLDEYRQAEKIFSMTLQAVKSGGPYPLDLKLEKTGHLQKIADLQTQRKIEEIEQQFAAFTRAVEDLSTGEVGSSGHRQAMKSVITQSNQLRRLNNDLVSIYTAIAEQNNSRIFYSTLGSLVFILALLAGAAVYFKRAVISRINMTLLNIQDIAKGEGDLTRNLDDSSADELGLVAKAFNEFIAKIRSILGDVDQETKKLGDAAEKTALVANEISAGVQRQHAETEQLATAITEMSATVSEVAKNAANAEKEAQNVDRSMHSGMAMVNKTVAGIHELSDEVDKATIVLSELESESNDIGTVLDVIRGIAEQTNLLALNAAIEAARAGEQGRGFAVVADEVRTLASRTQDSTQEIQGMIERLQAGANKAVQVMNGSKAKVEENVEQSNTAGEALVSISDAIATISLMNAQIASATEEQAATTEEINRNVTNIIEEAAVTAKNAALAEKANQELNHITVELKKLVGQFRL